jgi:hypothetical protein
MRKNFWFLAAAGAAAYWASRQPGGINGTWRRLQQGARDVAAGQDPLAVGRRFLRGTDEEPAGHEAGGTSATAGLAPQQPDGGMLGSAGG